MIFTINYIQSTIVACLCTVLLVGVAFAGQPGKPKKLTRAEIEEQVHANFEMWAGGQVVGRRGPGPNGISCGDICNVFGLDGCYEKGRASLGTYGRAGSCTRPMTPSSKRSCFCESNRGGFGFFYQEAVAVGGKVYRRLGDHLYGADPETQTVTRVKLPSFGRAQLIAGGPFIGFVPGNVPLEDFVRVDTRTNEVLVTKPKNKKRYQRCRFVPGVWARAWFCVGNAEKNDFRHLMIDAATSKQYQLPGLAFELRKYGVMAHWDGKRLLVGRPGQEEVYLWRPGRAQWEKHAGHGRPSTGIGAPDSKGAAEVYAAGVFQNDLASAALSSRALMGGFWGPRSRARWIGEVLYMPTRDGLWAFDVKAEKWTTWKLDRVSSHHGMFVVGDTIAIGDYLLHRNTNELRRLPLNLNAVFAGPYALIHRSSCPQGNEICKPLTNRPVDAFPGVFAWRPDVERLSREHAIQPAK